MWAESERDPDKAHMEIVYDPDLGTIAQISHPDGTVITAADAHEHVSGPCGCGLVDFYPPKETQ